MDVRGPPYTINVHVPCFVSLGIYFSKSPGEVFMILNSFELASFLKNIEHRTLGTVYYRPLIQILPSILMTRLQRTPDSLNHYITCQGHFQVLGPEPTCPSLKTEKILERSPQLLSEPQFVLCYFSPCPGHSHVLHPIPLCCSWEVRSHLLLIVLII